LKTGYDRLVNLGFDKHFRVNHKNNDFVSGSRHVNGIELLWSSDKRRLAKFNGIAKQAFPAHLKECDFRFIYHRHAPHLGLLKLRGDNSQ
jgi:transposase